MKTHTHTHTVYVCKTPMRTITVKATDVCACMYIHILCTSAYAHLAIDVCVHMHSNLRVSTRFIHKHHMCTYIYTNIYPPIYLPVCLSACLSVCLSIIYLYICRCDYRTSVDMFTCIYIYICVCVCVHVLISARVLVCARNKEATLARSMESQPASRSSMSFEHPPQRRSPLERSL